MIISKDKQMLDRRQVLSAGLAAGAALLCGPVAIAQRGPKLTLRLSLSGSVTEGLPYRLAKALGYLDEEGLTVDEQFVESRPLARDTISAGKADITNIGITTALRAIELDQPIRVLGALLTTSPVFIVVHPAFLARTKVEKSEFKSWTPKRRLDFLIANTARWASSTPGSLTDFSSQGQLKHFGFDIQKDLDVKYFPTPSHAVEGFVGGAVADIVITTEVILSRLARLLKENSISDLPLLLTRQDLEREIPSSLVPGEQWLANLKTSNPDALKAFLRAHLRATQYLVSKSVGEVSAIILKDNPDIISEQAKAGVEDAVVYTRRVAALDGKLTPAQVKIAIDFARAQGQIKGDLDPKRVTDWSFVEAAATTLPDANSKEAIR